MTARIYQDRSHFHNCWRFTCLEDGTNNIDDDVPPLCINSRNIERVVTFKLLGVVISSDLTWDDHVSYILSKCAKRIYCIWNLSGLPACDIVYIYCSVIRSVLEYACAVWHPGCLTNCRKILNVYRNVA